VAKKNFYELTGLAGCVAACRELIVGTVGAKCYLQYLASNVTSNDCTFFKSTQDAAAYTNLSEHTIRSLNKKWKELGIISITEHPWWSGDANDFVMHLPKLFSMVKAQRADGTQDAKKLKAKAKNKARQQKWRDNKAKQEAALEALEQKELVNA